MRYERHVIDVQTGEVGVGTGNTALVSSAIGSCIVIGLYDPVACAGGLAHAMLPGSAPIHGTDNVLKIHFERGSPTGAAAS
ncbi:MAG: hypothetical protein A2487_07680 [Candidatus Raymondbacteria bacterium RifOxyC12_full_50_8]|uniref:Chemotaxis protein CheD n=1 Tax=Candidatus Raymondbacteria bacterium RIFOXYD12_FULL_49_13 TaxID=1817890 RepID=A0A1F7F6I6_UNCRA|nr:MAG: hypothetical protein A2248_13280 [Candidatus Raymondbacteria bacterium RIFOXYA2_FULL_49_16]OGJ96070.1 MAG: hypothetical protein A2350_04720 [Candidatus Raymondbacteria bacterium RifOxyB12_full_50_8]OGJ99303.1 MAG: hypothetical protein A2487_07680 [Candidatus Raymondbacteria bacterium RifOxyC12_full_50_8]OGK02259.1 MAG: hypothetical protein A2519_16395 [Candidatus Raymondbacteria bacterium RIFOXYD12_FULL_49_13]OGP45128.1 MAG: hypothetical protein A2324_12075 [Candidatus Raymondbacteria b